MEAAVVGGFLRRALKPNSRFGRKAANLHGKRYAELWAERPLGSGSKWLVPADSERLASEDPVAKAAPQGQGEITWLTTL